jgi:hypothetical protein
METVSGVVEADADAVWDALLEAARSLTSMAGIHAAIDPARRTLTVSGQWWYRGEYTVRAAEHGSLVRYSVHNVAPPLTRWLVPLVAGRALRASARPMFERQLADIGTRLGARAYLTQ